MLIEPAVTIDLAALQHNLQQVRRFASGRKIMAVIKADGYGHGMLRVAGALAEADAFAVARISEGVQLRKVHRDKPIVVLGGFNDPLELDQAKAEGLTLVIHHPHQLEMLQQVTGDIDCWLKVDTGMNRLGFSAEDAATALQQLRSHARVVGVMSHLANADDRSDDYTHRQVKRFQQVTASIDVPRSLANSAGITSWPETHGDWVRPGIMLYGASPLQSVTAESLNLRPVMTFKAPVISVKSLAPGAPVGYGGIWRAPEVMRLGVVGAGYGDGYPREVSEAARVMINGALIPVVGRVSMDTLTIDLRGHDEVQMGDEVTLWGEGLPVDDIARAADTISYALLCGLKGRVRSREIDR